MRSGDRSVRAKKVEFSAHMGGIFSQPSPERPNKGDVNYWRLNLEWLGFDTRKPRRNSDQPCDFQPTLRRDLDN